ncbi:MAG: hypothetical protein KDI07_05310 [Anaerolineae bacterium]|nr:hypothetical protein [Anaerolineae bacterium]
MTGITLAEAQAHLSAAQAALTKARTAQSYSIGDRQVNRALLDKLQNDVFMWSRQVRELSLSAQGVTNPGYMVPKWD